MEKEIQIVEITTDTMVRLIFKTSKHNKDTYISVSSLVELLDNDFKRLSDLPENSADREHYIRSWPPDQPRPAWFDK